MSEDIDIKIGSDGPPARRALRGLRDSITSELLKAEFEFNPENPEHRRSNFESRYTLYRLPYPPLEAGQGALRPEVKIETSVWPMHHPPSELPVMSSWLKLSNALLRYQRLLAPRLRRRPRKNSSR